MQVYAHVFCEHLINHYYIKPIKLKFKYGQYDIN